MGIEVVDRAKARGSWLTIAIAATLGFVIAASVLILVPVRPPSFCELLSTPPDTLMNPSATWEERRAAMIERFSDASFVAPKDIANEVKVIANYWEKTTRPTLSPEAMEELGPSAYLGKFPTEYQQSVRRLDAYRESSCRSRL